MSGKKQDYGIAGSPNTNVPNPGGGGLYGYVPEMQNQGDVLPAGEVYLRVGKHSGPNSGFGVRHIWAEHEKEMRALGYSSVGDVPAFVASIITRGAPIYCEFNSTSGKHRTTVLKSSIGIVILEPRESDQADSGWIYTVVTAFTRKKAYGVLVGRIQ